MTIRSFVPAAAALLVLGAMDDASRFSPADVAPGQGQAALFGNPWRQHHTARRLPDQANGEMENADGNSPVLLIYGRNGRKYETSALTIHTVQRILVSSRNTSRR